MIDDIIRLYKIGKELGLTKKEINYILFYKNRKPFVNSILFWIIFLIILIVTFFTLSIMALNVDLNNSTYPSGTKYSTVKIKEFHQLRNRRFCNKLVINRIIKYKKN